jgi:hypothetical protein
VSQDRRFYVVRGKATHGSITHKCPTAALALDTLRRFERDSVQEVSLHGPDGSPLSPDGLEALATATAPQPEAGAVALAEQT